MKEYTLTYTAEITDVIPDKDKVREEDIMAITPEHLATIIKQMLNVDNVLVSDLKVFITGDSK